MTSNAPSPLLARYHLGQAGEARYVRRQLGAAQTGLTHYRLRPGRNQGWAHRHRVAEEIYRRAERQRADRS